MYSVRPGEMSDRAQIGTEESRNRIMARPKSIKTAPAKLPAAQAKAAYAKTEPMFSQVAADEIIAPAVDIPAAVSIVLRSLPSVRALRAVIMAELPKHPIALLDDLESYALAAWYAHELHENKGLDESVVQQWKADGRKHRESLLIAAEALAHRGLLDPERVASIRSGRGTEDMARDLIDLAELFRASWERVKAKTAVEEHELDEADDLGNKILMAHGPQAPAEEDGEAEGSEGRRARAFTLMYRAYDACRRAVSYLRWEQGDADEFMPPLMKKAQVRKASAGAGKDSSSSESAATGETPVPGAVAEIAP